MSKWVVNAVCTHAHEAWRLAAHAVKNLGLKLFKEKLGDDVTALTSFEESFWARRRIFFGSVCQTNKSTRS